MTIALLGGAFDPIHHGHLRLGIELAEQWSSIQVHFLPCAQGALKNTLHASAHHRRAMLASALPTEFILNDQELQRGGVSYAIDTVREQRTIIGDQPLLWVMGADVFAAFDRWRCAQSLLDFVHILVVERSGYAFRIPSALSAWFARHEHPLESLLNCPSGMIARFAYPLPAISSSAIRALVAQHRSPRFLLPDQVLDYIVHHQLYRLCTC